MRNTGFSLVEVLVALLIAVITVITLLTFLTTSLRIYHNSNKLIERIHAEASYVESYMAPEEDLTIIMNNGKTIDGKLQIGEYGLGNSGKRIILFRRN
jgi:type II secretory pathway component PulJ